MRFDRDRIERPWGWFEILHEDLACKTKLIHLNPGQKTSLQSHEKRQETWTITEGVGQVYMSKNMSWGEETNYYPLKAGESVVIPVNMIHRIINTGDKPLRLIEVQTGKSFEEEDITRYQDDYGRACEAPPPA